jgi:hypothetical protein
MPQELQPLVDNPLQALLKVPDLSILSAGISSLFDGGRGGMARKPRRNAFMGLKLFLAHPPR